MLQILINLEKSNLADRLQYPKEANAIELPIVVALGGASLYEALNEFDRIKKQARSAITPEYEKIYDSLNFLCSKEVTEIKRNFLARIRNKTAFHMDKEVIKRFLEEKNVSIMELISFDDIGQFSPFAMDIIGWHMAKSIGAEEGLEEMVRKVSIYSQIATHLKIVTYFLIYEWFEVEL
ncbi:hypothetical protein D3C77_471290 [compost metagenome]